MLLRPVRDSTGLRPQLRRFTHTYLPKHLLDPRDLGRPPRKRSDGRPTASQGSDEVATECSRDPQGYYPSTMLGSPSAYCHKATLMIPAHEQGCHQSARQALATKSEAGLQKAWVGQQ